LRSRRFMGIPALLSARAVAQPTLPPPITNAGLWFVSSITRVQLQGILTAET
jgi:hypothetical protein